VRRKHKKHNNKFCNNLGVSRSFIFPMIVGDFFMNIGDKTAENTSCVSSGLKLNYF